MAGVSMEAMKKVGRNMARANNQKGAGEPRLNENAGKSDGGAVVKGKSPRKTGVYRGQ
jgi:hypothetical protein